MSCITEILKKKGDKEFLVTQYVAAERGGVYKNYEWLVVFQPMGFRCGYVAISEDHPLYGKQTLQMGKPSLDCHGGITFNEPSKSIAFHFIDHVCTDEWIGFDAGHHRDAKDFDLVREVFKNYPKIISNTNSIEKIHRDSCIRVYGQYPKPKSDLWFENEEIRSADYMEQECKNLINSIIKYEKRYYARKSRKNTVSLRQTAAL